MNERAAQRGNISSESALPPIAPNAVRKPLFKKKKSTGELEVFKMILLERGAKSQISGTFISQPAPINFMHLLAKGQNKYPKFILRKDNIVIATAEEHHAFDNGSKEELRKKEEWKWIFQKIDELLKEYSKLQK